MDRYGSERIAAAIIISTLIVVVAFVVWPEYKAYRDRKKREADAAQLSAEMDKAERAARWDWRVRESQARKLMADKARMKVLAVDERCVGGVVVKVGKDRDGRPTFTQLMVRGRKVVCTGG